mgnify:FL=1
MDILFGLLAMMGDTVIALVFIVLFISMARTAIKDKKDQKEAMNARKPKPTSWRDYRG